MARVITTGSFKVVYNKQRVASDHTATIYIRVTIGRRTRLLPTPVRWPVNRFDWENGLCKKRFKDDPEVQDNNMIIRNHISRVNDIFKFYRITELPLTMERFLEDYECNYSRSSFLEYMEMKIDRRFREGDIAHATKRQHQATVAKLKKYVQNILFADFHENWARKFDQWLKANITQQKGGSVNSRWVHHKNIRTYLRAAEKDHNHFMNPYKYFKIAAVRGSWRPIFDADLVRLWGHYNKPTTRRAHKVVLRMFLFVCMTGLRISDLRRVDRTWLQDGILVYVPWKKRKSAKINRVPLNKIALRLWEDALQANPGRHLMFHDIEEQVGNRHLKDIAAELGIEANLHFHMGRHTFISVFVDKSGDIFTASQFADHENIKQTMVYAHLNQQEIKDKMKPMDDII